MTILAGRIGVTPNVYRGLLRICSGDGGRALESVYALWRANTHRLWSNVYRGLLRICAARCEGLGLGAGVRVRVRVRIRVRVRVGV